MIYLNGTYKKEAIGFLRIAAEVALKSSCLRSKCGSVIVSKDKILIGFGYNSPPGDIPLEECFKDELPEDFISDRTCCIHAEQRAIYNAFLDHSKSIVNSRLYFVRLDKCGDILFAGKPYCTQCSKSALDVGISEFVLWHQEGICVYDTKEFNELSFKFRPR